MRKWLVVAVLILASFGLAFLIDPFGEASLEDLIEHSTVYSELEHAGTLGSPVHSSSSVDYPLAEGQRREVLARSQSTYKGVLREDIVDRLITANLADLLEERLTENARRRLDRRLAPIEYALGEAGRAAFDECSAVKKKLIHRPDRVIPLQAWPRDADPRYSQVLRAREEIENEGLGVVWVDSVEGHEVHFIVKWKEWPILKSLRDEQYQLIVRRREAVQRWIEEEFERSGMKLFRGS